MYENGLGFTYDSGDYEGALDAALELARYDELRERHDGVGVALYVERCGPGSETGAVTVGTLRCRTAPRPAPDAGADPAARPPDLTVRLTPERRQAR